MRKGCALLVKRKPADTLNNIMMWKALMTSATSLWSAHESILQTKTISKSNYKWNETKPNQTEPFNNAFSIENPKNFYLSEMLD